MTSESSNPPAVDPAKAVNDAMVAFSKQFAGPVPAQSGPVNTARRAMLKAWVDAINKTSPEEFRTIWKAAIQLFHQDPNFGMKFIHRFPQEWTGTIERYQQYERLVNLLTLSKDPKTWNVMFIRFVDFNKLTGKDITDAGKNNLSSFYR